MPALGMGPWTAWAADIPGDALSMTMVSAGILQMFPAMGRAKILIGAEWNDTRGVNVIVGDVIMAFNVIHIHGFGHVIVLIEIFEVAKQIGIINDAPDITFEMSVIHRIESDERYEQTPICFHRVHAKEKPLYI